MAIKPHGGHLINGFNVSFPYDKLTGEIEISAFSLANLECIASGAYSPLKGFMCKADYEGVLYHMRLQNGLVWTLPVTLPIPIEKQASIHTGSKVKLVYEGSVYGVLEVEEIYEVDKELEAITIFGTKDSNHPGVKRLFEESSIYAGGNVTMVRKPSRIVPYTYYLTPEEMRKAFEEKGWRTIVGFQTRNPIHRAHEYIQKAALEITDGLLIHPLVGETKKDDIPPSIRMKSYEAIVKDYYSEKYTMIAAFPAPMYYAGPREAIFHAIVRKNYGCTHFIVGRDHAGVGNYYGTYDAQLIFNQFSASELGIIPLLFEHSFYCSKCGNIASIKTCPHNDSDRLILSGTKVRNMLANGERPPIEFSRPEVIDTLIQSLQKEDQLGSSEE
ncbi:sulfate adenylyltransferase [Metabacillus idriensis]|uniref:sulfate adenylyltransferase n=1 Tax=Metabacillus idriensis TaxID=324768 RepID=UPI00174D85A0|nr:sulfate adenylyltransferase [Metabacillus idriensis]